MNLRHQPLQPDPELRAALIALMWAVRAFRPSRQDARRAGLDAAMDRARKALREERQEETR